MHDLIIRGGQLLDPASDLRGVFDIAISDGRIAAIETELDPEQARRVVDVTNKLVTPGLIDVHAHCPAKLSPTGLDPEVVGVRAGVTTVVEAGTTGSHNFAGLRNYVLPNSRTRIICLLNIARTGLSVIPEIRTRDDIDLDATIRALRDDPSIFHGIKLRAIGPAVSSMGLDLVRIAKRAAIEVDGLFMVHIGDTDTPDIASLTSGLMSLLEPGDMVTHVFTSLPGGILDADGRVLPEAKEAYERGVVFDVAHGMRKFSFDVARRLLDQDIIPNVISTDLSALSRASGPVYSLTETMSKCLALGLSLDEVVRMTTTNPARFLRMADSIGALTVGYQADLSVLDLVTGQWELVDSTGQMLVTEEAIVPVLAVKGGEVIPVDWGPHPWGWLPAAKM